MYHKVECIRITCDQCNEVFVDFGSNFSIYVDESAAWSNAQDCEWVTTDDEKHYCPNCYTLDDEGEVILKAHECDATAAKSKSKS